MNNVVKEYVHAVPPAFTILGQLSLLVFVGDFGSWMATYWFEITRGFWAAVLTAPFSIPLTDSEKDGLTAVVFFIPLAVRATAKRLEPNSRHPLSTIFGLLSAVIILYLICSHVFSDAIEIVVDTSQRFYSMVVGLMRFQFEYLLYPLFFIAGTFFPPVLVVQQIRIKYFGHDPGSKAREPFTIKICLIVLLIFSISLYFFYHMALDVFYSWFYSDRPRTSHYEALVFYSIDRFFGPILMFVLVAQFVKGFFGKGVRGNQVNEEPATVSIEKTESSEENQAVRSGGSVSMEETLKALLWGIVYTVMFIYSLVQVLGAVGPLKSLCLAILILSVLLVVKMNPKVIINVVLVAFAFLLVSFGLDISKQIKSNIEANQATIELIKGDSHVAGLTGPCSKHLTLPHNLASAKTCISLKCS